jgi:predicted amidohydrolase
MRLAVVQTNPVFGEVQSNVRVAIEQMDSVPADLYVLPELFSTGYNFINTDELARLAESADGPTMRAIAKFAGERACYVACGFAEKTDALYNSAALVGPDGIIGVYRKVQLFNREKLLFAPGNVGFPVFDLPFGRVGMMICFDWIYPECARTLAMKGALLIIHPSNLVMPYCPDAMVTRCLENRIYSATANRVGVEDRGGIRFRYIGSSEIVSPRGEILERLAEDSPGVACMEVDLALARDKRINEFNDLILDRRTSEYR